MRFADVLEEGGAYFRGYFTFTTGFMMNDDNMSASEDEAAAASGAEGPVG